MNIIVLGAGAIGSVYGARLSKHHDVTLIGGAASCGGDPAGWPGHAGPHRRHAAPPRVCRGSGDRARYADPPHHQGEQQRRRGATDCGDASGQRHHRLRPERALLRELSSRSWSAIARWCLRAITQVGGVLVGPGIVDNTVAGYTLLESHDQSPAIAALLTEAGLDGRIVPDIKKEMWRKAVFNCVINPTTTLIGSEVGGIVDPQLNGLKQQIIDECLAVAKADGVTFEEDFLALIDRVFAGARTIASMRQDLMKGRKTEIDHMNGAVVDLGKKYGIDCPVNAAMTTMIRYLETQADSASEP